MVSELFFPEFSWPKIAGSFPTLIEMATEERDSKAKFLDPPKVTPELYKYLLEKGTRESAILAKLREATANHPKARMMSAPDQVSFFQFFLGAINAKKVIEVGVFTGYCTLACALSLPKDGKIIACDVSEEFTSVGKPFWKEAGVEQKIDLRIAPALETLDNLITSEGQTFDFAFVDADKANYVNYFERLLKLMKKGGVIAFDNVLWHGKVLDESAKDEDTEGIRKLNSLLHGDQRVEIAMLPISDGVTFVRVL